MAVLARRGAESRLWVVLPGVHDGSGRGGEISKIGVNLLLFQIMFVPLKTGLPHRERRQTAQYH